MRNKIVNLTRALYLLAFLAAFVIGGQAQNQIDPTFNAVPSAAPSAIGQAVQADGKIVIWGNALTVDGVAKDQIARLNADGTLDTSYLDCGCHMTNFKGAAMQADGKMLLAGSGPLSEAKIIRLNTNGTIDATFNTAFAPGGGTSAGFATIFNVLPDGKLMVRTDYFFTTGTSTMSVYRVNADGSTDSSFAPIVLGYGHLTGSEPTVVVPLADGKFIVAVLGRSGSTPSTTLRLYNSNGSQDTSWSAPNLTIGGNTQNTSVADFDTQTDGSIIIGGHFDGVNGLSKFSFARIFEAGNVDTTFNPTGFVSGNQVQALSTGKVLVGASTNISGDIKIYRLNSDGTNDATFTFDPAINKTLTNFSLDSAGRIVFFGQSVTGESRFFRINVNGDLDTAFNSNVGSASQIKTSASQPDGKVVVAGPFLQMNGVARVTIARLNANGSLDASFDPGTGFSSVPVRLLVQSDGKILAVGQFTTYNGVARNGLARLNTDGSLDTAFNPTLSPGMPSAAALQADGKILVGGQFTTVNGTGQAGLARLNSDGSLDAAFAPIIGTPWIEAIGVGSDGKITFSGSFNGVNGFSRSGIARINSDGSVDQTFNPGSLGIQPNMWLQPDGKVLYGFRGLNRRNNDGSLDNSFIPLVLANDSQSPDPLVDTVLVQADGSIIVGGIFNKADNVIKNNIARLSSAGAVDTAFFPNGANDEVFTLAAQASGKVVVGGKFTIFENSVRAGIVRISTTTFQRPAPFDFDGDGRADISVTRSAGVDTWYQLLGASYTFNQVNFGQTGDVVAPADFDGDGKTDVAIYRPSNGQWWYISSLDGSQRAATWVGQAGDIALPSDYNGDGKADYILYRPSTGQWLRLPNGGLTSFNITFGAVGDKPLVGDFDGDGKSDPAIFRPSTGTFWYAASSQNDAQRAFQWGSATDIPAVADYDGDGKTDYAIYRPSSGQWWVFNSSTQNYTVVTWGAAEDKPIPADYDGDGKADFAVFRPSNGTWYLLTSTSGFKGFQWGISTDVPSPGAYVP